MIIPDHAARVWVSNSLIWMEFNSSKSDRTHAVHFPATPDGFALALDILKARTPASTVATKGSPIQYDVEKLARNFLAKGGKIVTKDREKFSTSQRANAREVLRTLGLL